MSDFVTYKTFPTRELANDLTELLTQNNVPFRIDDFSSPVSDLFVGNDVGNNILVKVKPQDFEKVTRLLEKEALTMLEEVRSDHYLYDFDNEELIAVITEPDKWHELDVQLAKKILADRDVMITPEMEEAFYIKRLKELHTPQKANKIWIRGGYIFAFLGGLLGIIIGYNYWQSKNTLPNGKRVYVYEEQDRIEGKRITILGIIVLVAGLIYRIISAVD